MAVRSVLPSGPGPHRVCGRECTDGSPCRNMVTEPGAACWIDSHRDEDSRVDGGPEDPSEVPLSGLGERFFEGVAGVGGVVGFAAAWWLGFGRLGVTVLSSAGAVGVLIAVALAMDAYQRRALRAAS